MQLIVQNPYRITIASPTILAVICPQTVAIRTVSWEKKKGEVKDEGVNEWLIGKVRKAKKKRKGKFWVDGKSNSTWLDWRRGRVQGATYYVQ